MGRATARALAKRGAAVAVLDRPTSAGREVADELGGVFFECDVTDFEGAEQALADAVAELGGLHIAVTTAGGGAAKRTLTKEDPHDLETFRRVLDLNVVGTFNLNRLSADHMSRKSRRTTSAASSSTPRPSPPSRARSARSPTRPPRPRSPACH
jgi:NAD(P)-dependent dehydrogenase (short-subunit alcohol dehydrogenase family)